MQQKNIKLKDSSIVKTFNIIIQKARPGKIFVGSRETNSYIIIDEFWKDFVDLLGKPLTIAEISKELVKKYPQEFKPERSLSQVKMMMIYFIQNKLIKEIDNEKIYHPKRQKINRRQYK